MKITLRDALTIPNILSYIRLLMIPFFTVLYMKGQYLNAGILAVLSGMSDVIDGWIARKFNQVTDLGKVLDLVTYGRLALEFIVLFFIAYAVIRLIMRSRVHL